MEGNHLQAPERIFYILGSNRPSFLVNRRLGDIPLIVLSLYQ